jgi:hypothetical protein
MSAPVTSAERERQRGRGERAEDGQQDQRDDREADALGRREIVLGELLEPGPERGLPDEVRRDRTLRAGRRADPELLAQVGGDIDRVPVVDVDAQRDDRGARLGRGLRGLSERLRRDVDVGGARGGVAQPLDGGPVVSCGRPVVSDQDDPEQRSLRGAEVALDRVLDRVGLRAGDGEPAAGEVVGLAGGERQRGDEQDQPHDEHEAATAAEEAVQREHERQHGAR